MKRTMLCTALVLFAAAAPAREGDKAAPAVVVKPISTTAVTASGQPIVLPSGNARVTVSTYEIPRNATLPEHKHPFPRYAYVVEGELRVTNTETGRTDVYKAGDFVIEAIGQWHHAVNLGDGPVKLLVIDQVPGEASNVIMRK